jgi:hypothetical protein
MVVALPAAPQRSWCDRGLSAFDLFRGTHRPGHEACRVIELTITFSGKFFLLSLRSVARTTRHRQTSASRHLSPGTTHHETRSNAGGPISPRSSRSTVLQAAAARLGTRGLHFAHERAGGCTGCQRFFPVHQVRIFRTFSPPLGGRGDRLRPAMVAALANGGHSFV